MCLAVPGRVLEVFEENGTTMAEVDFGGVRKRVCLAYLPETEVGEYVIVHVGFAIQRLDEEFGDPTAQAEQDQQAHQAEQSPHAQQVQP